MLKIAAILSLFLIGSVWGQGISCDSCGSECASACGTRHFRSCCFNYLRKKRPDTFKMHHYYDGQRQNPPFFTENLPDDSFRWFANDRYGLFDGVDERE
ncbi:unnamed protein product [Pieris macdunnoughi]|uniref:Trissin n=1 Tax=Pieris macdunnoughi TaxID=345717 RepID=A0A821XB92_9NEOP|nr:unnamed protein product [Pieris macdunnoughi]